MAFSAIVYCKCRNILLLGQCKSNYGLKGWKQLQTPQLPMHQPNNMQYDKWGKRCLSFTSNIQESHRWEFKE